MRSEIRNIARIREHGTDPDMLAGILSSSISRIDVEHVRGEFSFECQGAMLGRLALIDAKYEGDLSNRRQAEGDKLVLIVPRNGGAVIHMKDHDIVSAPNYATIFESRSNKGMSVSGPRNHLTAVLSHTELRARLSNILGISINRDVDFHSEIDISTGNGLFLRHLVTILHRELISDTLSNKSSLVLTNIMEAFLNHFLWSIPHNYSEQLHAETVSPSPRHVKRSIDFMRSHLAEPITMEQIVAASGVSTRALQAGFRQFKSTTPMGYLRDLRLEAVQAELASGSSETAVAEVATKWGFFHLGRFSADYRARFGELPSHTLRNRKG